MKKLILTIIVAISILPIGCGKLIKQTDNRQDIMNIQTNKDENIEQIQEKNYEVAYNPTRVVFNGYTVEETLEIADKLVINHANAKEAYGLYKWITEQDPTNANALIGRGYCYGTVSNYPKALEYVEKAKPYLTTEMEPKKLAEAYYSMGLIYAGTYLYEQDKYLNDMEEAFNEVFKIQGLSDKDKQLYYCHTYYQQAKGYNKFTKENQKKAIESLIKLNELNPNDNATNGMLASAYINIGQLDKAKEYIDYVVEHFPDEMTKVLTHAKYYSALGESSKAENYFDKSEELKNTKQDNLLYYASLVKHKIRIQDFKGAQECLRQLLDAELSHIGMQEFNELAKEVEFEIDPKYIEAYEKAKQEAYSTSLE